VVGDAVLDGVDHVVGEGGHYAGLFALDVGGYFFRRGQVRGAVQQRPGIQLKKASGGEEKLLAFGLTVFGGELAECAFLLGGGENQVKFSRGVFWVVHHYQQFVRFPAVREFVGGDEQDIAAFHGSSATYLSKAS